MRRVLAPFLLLCLAALTLPACAPTSRWAGGHRDVVALLQGASQGLPPPGRLPPNADQTAPPARDD